MLIIYCSLFFPYLPRIRLFVIAPTSSAIIILNFDIIFIYSDANIT